MEENENNPFVGKKILTIDDVAGILLKDTRTINSYVKKGIISKPIVDTDIISFDAQTLAEKLGVVDFSEPFIRTEDAETILGLKKGMLTNSYCKKLTIPFYSLSSKEGSLRGTRLLFRKSELEGYQQKYTTYIIEADTLWIENVARERMVVMLYGHFDLLIGLINPDFTEKERCVLKEYLQGKKLQDISGNIELTTERVRQILEETKKVFHLKMKAFVDWYQETCASEKYKGVSPKNIIEGLNLAKEKIRQLETTIHNLKNPNSQVVLENTPELEKILSIEFKDLDLSVRASNCLKDVGIKTFGELIKWSTDDLLKFRNFGKKSLDELRDLLHQKGFQWNDTDKPAELITINRS